MPSNTIEKVQATAGAKTIENLAKDLKSTFPEMKGFSLINIKYMVQLVNKSLREN